MRKFDPDKEAKSRSIWFCSLASLEIVGLWVAYGLTLNSFVLGSAIFITAVFGFLIIYELVIFKQISDKQKKEREDRERLKALERKVAYYENRNRKI